MPPSPKKVILRHLDGHVTWGYLLSTGFVTSGHIEFMAIDGSVTAIPVNQIRHIAYVRDFNTDDPRDPERLGRRTFAGRPRLSGLWVRLGFLDDEALEGITDFDITTLTAIAADGGLTITPPDGRSNTLKLFVPRAALASIEVLGWITSTAKPAKPAKPQPLGQGDLFTP